MDKLLSVIVPSYNMEKYLPTCLGSLIVDDAALLQQLDVIVVNDGSKDRTSEIAHEFEAKYPGVFRVIDKENAHYGSCVNAGLKIATGLYIKILDADDWFDVVEFSKYFMLLSADVERGQIYDVLINDFAIVEEKLRVIRSYKYVGRAGFDLSEFFRNGKELWMHAVSYRVSMLRELLYYQMEGITHTDVQWIHTPIAAAKSVNYYPCTIYEYKDDRMGNTSNPIGFLKTFSDLVAVTRQLIVEFPTTKKMASETTTKYLYQHLRYRACRVYYVHIVHESSLLDKQELSNFDAFLKETNRELYDSLDDESLGGKLKVRYIHVWRRQRRVTVMLRLFVALQKFYGKLRSI